MEEFLNPQKILNNLELRKDMVAADFGSGSGGWVIPLSKILEDGKVFAIDVLSEPLSVLESKAKLEKLLNIETIQADVESGSKLPEDSCDFVIMANLLFQCEDKKGVISEGKRVLKPGGRILVVDWKIDAHLGPKEGRVSAEEIKSLAQELGLKTEKEFSAGTYHYGLIMVK